MTGPKPEPVAWIYELQWPNDDDDWWETTSRYHPYDDDDLDERDSVEVRNIRGLVEVDE